MLPTLKPDQDILSFNWAYFWSDPKVGDIVVVKINGRKVVKRIQTIDDQNISVVGDNQKGSTDSRTFGPIKRAHIIGKVIWGNWRFQLNVR